jgi:hypothetical protein
MMVALLLYAYSQGERSSRVIEKRCVRDVPYRVITGGLRPDHVTIARFRARHEKALGGLFSQVLRLLAAEGMVAVGMLSLDGTKLADNASQKANRTLPQTGEAARRGGCGGRRRRYPGSRRPAAGDAAGAGESGGRGWLPPGIGWRRRTTRSGPSSLPLRRARRLTVLHWQQMEHRSRGRSG